MERSSAALATGVGIGAAITFCVTSFGGGVAASHASHDLVHAAATRGKAEAVASAAWKWRSRSAKVYRVVLTGGPCGGKSSSQQMLYNELTKDGFDCMEIFFCLPGKLPVRNCKIS